MSSIIGPFVGQNLGAGKYERISAALRESTAFCIVFGVCLALVVMLSATTLLGLFSDDAGVVESGRLYLWIMAPAFGAAGIVMVVNAAFNGIGRPGPAVVVSMIRMFLIMVPLSWFAGRFFGIGGVFLGLAIANFAAALLAWAWYRRHVNAIS
jgi:Na+-driven multidrug efflux pump